MRPPRLFDGAGEGAIVDQLAPDAGDAADAVQRFAADEDAAAGGSRGAAAGIADPGRRIEQEEEEDEGGDQRLLGEGAAVEADHVGDQVVVAGAGAGDQGGDVLRMMHDIGVGEQEVFGGGGVRRLRRRPTSLPVQPGGGGAGGDHVEVGCGLSGEGGGAIGRCDRRRG